MGEKNYEDELKERVEYSPLRHFLKLRPHNLLTKTNGETKYDDKSSRGSGNSRGNNPGSDISREGSKNK